MQISHVLKKEFMPERLDTLSVITLWLLSIGVRLILGTNNHYLAAIAMVFAMFDCFRFFIKIAMRMARMMNILVFGFTEKKKIK